MRRRNQLPASYKWVVELIQVFNLLVTAYSGSAEKRLEVGPHDCFLLFQLPHGFAQIIYCRLRVFQRFVFRLCPGIILRLVFDNISGNVSGLAFNLILAAPGGITYKSDASATFKDTFSILFRFLPLALIRNFGNLIKKVSCACAGW